MNPILEMRRRHAAALGIKAEDRLGVVASFARTKTIDRGERGFEIETIATTDDVDSDDEVVMPRGLDWSYLLKNRKLFADHMYTLPHVVGTVRSIAPYPDPTTMRGWKIVGALLKLDSDQVKTIKALASDPDAGVGMSIGFLALESGQPTRDEEAMYPGAVRMIRKALVLEASYTAMPANVNCQGGMRLDDSKMPAFERLARKGRIPSSVVRSVVDFRNRAKGGIVSRETVVLL